MTAPVGEPRAVRLRRRLDAICTMAHVLLAAAQVDPVPLGIAETVRRQREASTLLMQTTWPVAVFEGPDHTVKLLNAAWCATFGTSTTGLAQAWSPGLQDVLRTGEPVHLEEHSFRSRHHGIERVGYCSATLQATRGPLGEITGVIVVCGDITDDVIARQLQVDVTAPIWSGAVDHPCDYYSRRWSEYTGLVGDAYAPTSWQQVIHAQDRSRCEHAFREAARQRTSTAIEARLLRADGAYRWHRVQFVIDARSQRWYGTALDIHDARNAAAERTHLLGRERAARADAEQANRLKDQFLAAVSHELRAPLTTMLLWEKVLRDQTVGPELHARALDAIHQSAAAQSRLVADLLDVSRAISGKLHVDLRALDIAQILYTALERIAPLAAAKGLELESRLGPLLGEVSGDATRLLQVFDNLLSNAVKFTDRGGRVTVAAHRDARSVIITVVDTGRGIAQEFLPRLFQPFSQSDDALTRSVGGLGLGLAIASQLVELHRGTLVAASEGHGRGASFTVTLPVGGSKRASTPTGGTWVRGARLHGIRVLVIDDDERVRDALAVLLGRAGATVETAESSDSGIAALHRTAPDVILCDIAMPVEDGYSFARRLRACRGSLGELPAIALTGHATSADAERSLAAGFDLHLSKPIDLDVLAGLIHDLVVGARGSRPIT